MRPYIIVKPRFSFKEKFSELFGIDLRSLALFRIGIALLIIVDLINRARDLRAHYTDWGVMPRGTLLEEFARSSYLSLHLINGLPLFQVVLFVVAGLLALGLLIGYRTRLMTVLSWILLISLQSRNPMVLQAGDVVLRMYLFWGMFLPLGASYSVDSAFNNSTQAKPTRILSAASVAILLQVFMVYFFTAVLKDHPRWWVDGTAIYYALSIDQFTTPLGHYVLQFEKLLQVLTIFVIYLEFYGPFIAFTPILTGPIRTVTAFAFMGLHVGFIFFMKLGLFPYISIIGWFLFLPTWFWDRIFRRLRSTAREGLKIYYDGDCGFCKKMVLLIRTFCLLPETPLLPAQQDAAIAAEMTQHNSWIVIDAGGVHHMKFEAVAYVCSLSPLFWPVAPLLRWRPVAALGEKIYERVASERSVGARLLSWMSYRPLKTRASYLGSLVVIFCLIYVLMWNLRTLSFAHYEKYFPRRWNWFAYTLRIDQYWNMFAPYPLRDDGWYVIVAQLKNGDEIDIFRGGQPVSWEKPALVAADYSSQRWRKYMMNIWKKRHRKNRVHYGRYLCRQWNERHKGGERLETFDIYFMRENTPPPGGTATPRKVKIWSHDCAAKSGSSSSRRRRGPNKESWPADFRERMRIQKEDKSDTEAVDSPQTED